MQTSNLTLFFLFFLALPRFKLPRQHYHLSHTYNLLFALGIFFSDKVLLFAQGSLGTPTYMFCVAGMTGVNHSA
jgi:hypothetical protein